MTTQRKTVKGREGERERVRGIPAENTPTQATKKPTKPKTYNTKTARPDPLNKDPAISCNDPREEQFCNYMAQGFTGIKSYQLAINARSSNKSAVSRASEMKRRPDLACRILTLQATTYRSTRSRGPKQAQPLQPQGQEAPRTPQQPQQPPEQPEPPSTNPVTRADLERIISSAVRTASTAGEKTQAVKMAMQMLGLDRPENAPVDPVALLDYITRTAGRTPQDIAAETGGLRYLLERVATLSRQPRSVVARIVSRWLKDLRATEPDTEATPEATPDA